MAGTWALPRSRAETDTLRGFPGEVMSEVFGQGGAGFAAGSRVGGYLLEERIGHGVMAIVFRALDDRLGRHVALKIVVPRLAADEMFRRRFIKESRIAATAVSHPHIIPVFEVGEADGALFVAMRYVRGGDVRSLLSRDGALAPVRVAAIVSPIAAALDAVHGARLAHRDVKPSNILLDVSSGRPAHVYLAEFGAGKEEALDPVMLTMTGQYRGTFDYAPPERFQGGPLGPQADQYAFGCAAFEMLCGVPPFRRDQAIAVLYAHLKESPPPVPSMRAGLRADLDLVFARVLAKSPQDRYRSCQEFSNALRIALGIAAYDPESCL